MLQLLEISQFQFHFHHDYTRDVFHFRLSFRFNFQIDEFNFHRAGPPPQDLQHGLDLPVEVEELAVQHLRAEVDADLRREEERRLRPVKKEVLRLF